VEFYAPQPPVNPLTLKFAGSPDFDSETLLAYELGYRIQPIEAASISLAGFYNQYDDMRSVEIPHPDPRNPTVEFLNGLKGDSRGVELSGRVQAFPWWTLRVGYTYLEKDIWTKEGHLDFTNPRGEWNDPSHQVSIHSMTDLPGGFQANVFGYYVDDLPMPAIQGRFAYDAGLVWIHGNVEVSLQGRNLADDRDPEFAVKDRVVQEAPRSMYGRIAWRL
jgi:iron complex outermembrane receptor protein